MQEIVLPLSLVKELGGDTDSAVMLTYINNRIGGTSNELTPITDIEICKVLGLSDFRCNRIRKVLKSKGLIEVARKKNAQADYAPTLHYRITEEGTKLFN